MGYYKIHACSILRLIGPGPATTFAESGVVTDLGNPSPSPETNGWKNYMATYGMALTSEMAGTGETSICFLVVWFVTYVCSVGSLGALGCISIPIPTTLDREQTHPRFTPEPESQQNAPQRGSPRAWIPSTGHDLASRADGSFMG